LEASGSALAAGASNAAVNAATRSESASRLNWGVKTRREAPWGGQLGLLADTSGRC